MAEINFLAADRRRLEISESRDKKAFLAFFVVAIAVLIIFAVILAVRIYFETQNSGVVTNINRVKAEVNRNADNERDYLVFYNKTHNLTEILELRKKATEEIMWTSRYFEDNDVRVSSVLYDMFAGEFQLVLQSYSVFYFQEILDLIARAELQERFAEVNNLNLIRDVDGAYNLTVSFELK